VTQGDATLTVTHCGRIGLHGRKINLRQCQPVRQTRPAGRDDHEIRDWARACLPYFEGQVPFPDRLECEVDGQERHEDIEPFTPYYRGAHAANRTKTGFRIYVVASRGGGGSEPHPRILDELL
jgi:hypothetical protein